MPEAHWLDGTSPAFRMIIATSWLAPDPWRARQEEALRKAYASAPDWTEYLYLVNRHRTPALSWAALKRVPDICIPEHAMHQLQKRSDTCRMQAMVHLQLLAKILRSLNRASIPVIPLKGQLLSLELYGDSSLRQSKDLDILVPESEILRAEACLADQGWLRSAEYPYLTPRQLRASLRYERHIGYVHAPSGHLLELHWRIKGNAESATEACWQRSITTEWRGVSYQSMSAPDLTLYLCNHGGEHAWFRAKWLGDLARIHANGGVDWYVVLDQARKRGQERALLLCLHLLEEGYELPSPLPAADQPGALPALLTRKAIRDLQASSEPGEVGPLGRVVEQIRSAAYERSLWRFRSWSQIFVDRAYSRVDFSVLRLSDSLFWLYVPLRPLIFAWRRILRFRRVSPSTR